MWGEWDDKTPVIDSYDRGWSRKKAVVGVYMPVVSHDTGLTSKMWKVFNQFPKLFDEN